MSAVEQFTGGVNWTVIDACNRNGVLKKSKSFVIQVDGQNVTFTLSALYTTAYFLSHMYEWQAQHSNGTTLLGGGYSGHQLAIYVKSSVPIKLVPKLQLMADNGTWFDLPINWKGPDGKKSDKMFFGSTKFMEDATLKANYFTNNTLNVKCSILPEIPLPLVSLQLQSDFGKLFKDGLYCDMVLVSDRREIKVSKGILAARSPVFAAMFEQGLEETQSGGVEITDVNYRPLRALIKFLYTDQIDFNDDCQFALQMFVAADKYDVKALKDLTQIYISKNISDANVIETLHVSKSLNSLLMKNTCLDFIANKKAADVLAIPGINELYRELFAEVIAKLRKDRAILPEIPLPLVSSQLQSDFEMLFENSLHCDMVFVSEGQQIKVSKGILAARSPVFAAMFEHKLEETESGRVNITDVKYEPLRALLKFLYTDMVDFKNDGQFALQMFVVADKYDVKALKALAEICIYKNISDANVIEALHVSKALNSSLIKQACFSHIAVVKASDVLTIPGINELDRQQFAEILAKLCKDRNG